jgi:hypothetical protein
MFLRVLANIMTESSPLLLEMCQKLRTQISEIPRDCIMVGIRLWEIIIPNDFEKHRWQMMKSVCSYGTSAAQDQSCSSWPE